MESVKSPFSSLTIWGAVVAVLPAVSELAADAVSSGLLPPKYAAIVTAVGSGAALIGRWIAKARLGF